ncbi:hypothetical protein BDZ97DRAFT_1819049 [Flammula alnicola]|nr:hypothetical protein BDZ97DRAFT_1819049 [Flammula alnicola]
MQHTVLPIDITDAIIDELDVNADKKSLASVSLASRTLCARAQARLFQVIDLNPICCPSLNSKRYTYFKELLIESPGLRQHVRKLSIGDFSLAFSGTPYKCQHHAKDDLHMLSGEIMEGCFIEKVQSLPFILDMLPRVEHFAINSQYASPLVWGKLPVASRYAIATFIQQNSITSLHLNMLKNAPSSFIIKIAHLSQLISLRLENIHVDPEDVSHLTNLTKSSLTNLRELWLVPESPSPYNINLLGALILQAARDTLERFTWYSWTCLFPPINVGISRNLKTLSLQIWGRPFSVGIQPFLEQLMYGEQATLEIIELRAMQLIFDEGLKGTREDWSDFDDLLQHSVFSKLMEICLIEYYRPPYEHELPVNIFLKSMFPKTCARGVDFTLVEMYLQ